MQTKKSIDKALKDLRVQIDSADSDPILKRISYAIETAIVWATQDTVGWPKPAKDAIEQSDILRDHLIMDAEKGVKPMKQQIIVDLETLGKKPGAVILSIGAAKFGHGEILDTFYERINIESSLKHNFEVDAPTILWWMEQNDEARREICQPGKDISSVLENFRAYVGNEGAEIWGNGADFDNVLLSYAYNRLEMRCPWTHRDNRCYRTLKNLCPQIELVREGCHHNALDDAISQAKHLMEILEYLKI